jgi:hypothetical protein
MPKVTVAYDHDGADLSPIFLAVVPRGVLPGPGSWVGALRDTVTGKRVVWARLPAGDGVVWLRDRDGHRPVPRLYP